MGDWADFIPNYTGPWISNGSFQSSVEFGNRRPKDQLDALSRLHDSAYAKWDDRLHRTVADEIYNDQAKELIGKFPELARFAVLYGNHTARSASKLFDRTSHFGALGLVMGGLENMYDLHQYISNKDKIREEILGYYKTDPYIQFQNGGSKNFGNMGNKTSYYDPKNFDSKNSVWGGDSTNINNDVKGEVWGSENDFKNQIPKTSTQTYNPSDSNNSRDYDTVTDGNYNGNSVLNDPFAYERSQIIFQKKKKKKSKKRKKIFPSY